MSSNPTLPKEGSQDIPIEISKFYPSELEAKKIKKPLIVYLLDVSDKRVMPTLVQKPLKVKYGSKWFNIGGKNGQRYFINYGYVMNFGKHYAYLCQYGNSVGALSFHEYTEFADANQVEMMVNQHAVEVFKKHKGISPKLVMIIAIVAAIGVIGSVISSQIALAENNQINSLKTQLTTKDTTIKDLQCQLDTLSGKQCVITTTDSSGKTVTTVKSK